METQYDIFISHSGEGGNKTTIAIPFKRMFDCLNLNAFVDALNLRPGDEAPLEMKIAAKKAKVFLAVLDHHHFPSSKYCMEELRDALEREQYIFPLFLSDFESYPTSVENAAKVNMDTWGADWSPEVIADLFSRVISIAGLRAKDTTFENEYVPVSIEAYLRKNRALTINDFKKPRPQKRVKQLRRRMLGAYDEIKLCKATPLDDNMVDLHIKAYDDAKMSILNERSKNKSAMITGEKVKAVRGSGGVGKTWLALRLVHDKDVINAFSDGIFWLTFGEEQDDRLPFENLWYDLGGASTERKFEYRNRFALLDGLLDKMDFEALFVLDDIWHKEQLNVFSDLLKNHPTLRLLVTTRFKQTVDEQFGQHCEVIQLLPRLEPVEALHLMKQYSDSRGGVDYDEKNMLIVGSIFGFHPKALSIICTQAPAQSSWKKLASMLGETENEIASEARDEAKEYVFAAIEKVFEFQKKKGKSLKKRFCKLGQFKEDRFFSLDDITIVLELETTANATIQDLKDSSILEAKRIALSKADAVYSFHDLTREYARENGSNDERAFIMTMLNVAEENVSRATAYMFQNLQDHIEDFKTKTGENLQSAITSRLREIETKARNTGEVEQKFRGNAFLVASAFSVKPELLDEMDARMRQVFLHDQDFLKTALNSQVTRLDIVKSKWIKDESLIDEFFEVVRSSKTLKQLSGLAVEKLKGSPRNKEIYMNSRYLGDVHGIIIGQLISNNMYCIELNLYKNNIGPDGGVAIGKALAVNTALTSLKLTYNQIGPDGAVAIGGALAVNSTLTSLSLYDNKIGDQGAIAIRNGLKENKALTDLDLSENKIGPIGAEAIGEVLKVNTTLTVLHLRSNEIGDQGAIAIGNGLKENRALINLNLSGHPLPVMDLKGGVEEIELSGKTNIDAIVIAILIGENTELSVLNLLNNNIGPDGGVAIGKALAVNTALTSLNLRSNQMIGDDGAIAIGNGLRDNKALKKIDLKSKRIGNYGAIAIGNGLKKNKALTFLNLDANQIGPDGAVAIGGALAANSTLTNLRLTYNQIGPDGAVAIGGALAVNSTLTSLSLYDNKIGDQGAIAIRNGLKENKALTDLDLRSNEIGDQGAIAIGNGLKENRALINLNLSGHPLPVMDLKGGVEKIDLSGKRLTNIDAIVIAILIGENTELSVLNLLDNKIRDGGAIAIGNGLKENKALKHLNLDYNLIRDDGAVAIGGALAVNSTLTSLNLGGNEIGKDGALAIGGALVVNSTLTSLNLSGPLPVMDLKGGVEKIDLSGKSLTNIDAIVIAILIGENTELSVLNLGGNEIGKDGAEAIGETLKVNTTLLYLDLSWNTIGDQGAIAIGNGLKENKALKGLYLSGSGPLPVMDLKGGVEKIDLSGKSLTNIDAIVIAILIGENTELSVLNLYFNYIGDEGRAALEPYGSRVIF